MSTDNTTVTTGEAVANIAKASLANLTQNKSKLEDLANEYRGLTITGVADKDGIKKAKAGITATRTARTDIDKLRKAEKAYILEAGKLIDTTAAELTAIVAPIEGSLKDEVERIEQEQERINQEELRKKEEKKAQRTAKLFETGLSFSGTHFTIGELSITPIQVVEYSESQFEGFIAQANVEYEAMEMAKRDEEERLANEKMLAQQQKEQAEREAETARAAQLAAQREADSLLQERTDTRMIALKTAGFDYRDGENGQGFYHPNDYYIAAGNIRSASRTDWDIEMQEFGVYSAEVHAREEEANRLATQQEATEEFVDSFSGDPGIQQGMAAQMADSQTRRINQLVALGFTAHFGDNDYRKNGVHVAFLDIQCHSDEQWDEMMVNITSYLDGLDTAIDAELGNAAEKQAAYLSTNPQEVRIIFTTEMPFIEVTIGKAVQIIFIEDFRDQVVERISSLDATVTHEGTITGDLLFIIYR